MPSHFTFTAVGIVHSPIREPLDDVWGGVTSRIELDSSRFAPDCLKGLDEFSHVEIAFTFHRIPAPKFMLARAGRGGGRTGPRWAFSLNAGRIGPTGLGSRCAACSRLRA